MNHSTPGYDIRGSAADRRARRAWLLSQGDGKTVPCHHCGKPLNRWTLQVDRFPICGHDGGRYTRDNIVPACGRCNRTRCPRCTGLPERPFANAQEEPV